MSWGEPMKKIIGFALALFAASVVHAVQPGPIPAGHNYINTGTKIQTTSTLVVYSSQTPGAFYLSTTTTGSPLSLSVDSKGIELYDLNFINFITGPTIESPNANEIDFKIGGNLKARLTPSTFTVFGMIETSTGGVKFPDGSIQTVAASTAGGAAFPLLAPNGTETNPSYSFSNGQGGGMFFADYPQLYTGVYGPAIFPGSGGGGGPLATVIFTSGDAVFTGAIVASTGSFIGGGGLNGAGGGYQFGLGGLELSTDGISETLSIDDFNTGKISALFDPNGIAEIKTSVKMSYYGAGAATFDANGNLSSVSDEHAKERIRPFSLGLESVVKLHPVKYRYNKESGLDRTNDYTGFTTQDVEKSIPEAVFHSKNGYSTLWDRAILAAVVNSVKELKKENDDLKARMEKLERK